MKEASGSIGYSCHYPRDVLHLAVFSPQVLSRGAIRESLLLSQPDPRLLGLQIKFTKPGSALEEKEAGTCPQERLAKCQARGDEGNCQLWRQSCPRGFR